MRGSVVVGVVVACVVASACTSATGVEDDPAATTRAALEALRAEPAVQLTARLDGEVGGLLEVDPTLAPLLTDGRLELRARTGDAVHVRVVAGADEATRTALAEGAANLRRTGVAPVADAVATGGWIRVTSAPPPGRDATDDTAAAALADAGTELLDAATAVRWLGTGDRGDHVQLTVPTGSARATSAEALARVLELDQDRPRGADEGEVAVDLWLDDGEVVGIRLPLQALVAAGDGPPLAVDLTVHADATASAAVTDERAPPFALQALLTDLFAASSPGPGGGPTTSPSPGPGDGGAPGDDAPSRPRPSEPPQLRPGGVVEDALGDGDVFVEGEEFDCLTDEDLAVLADQLGPDAVAEVEELVTAGYLERCPDGPR